MKALVVYSSRTGNTRKIAEAIAAVLPGCEIHPVESAPAPEGYDLVAVGYWVDKGMPDAQAKAYLETVRDRECGFVRHAGRMAGFRSRQRLHRAG